jgi:hypothetical protein
MMQHLKEEDLTISNFSRIQASTSLHLQHDPAYTSIVLWVTWVNYKEIVFRINDIPTQ